MDEKGQGMPFNDPLGMAANLKSWFESQSWEAANERFELSNVGHLKRIEEKRLYSINTLQFTQSASGTGGGLKISPATGPDGALIVGISWQHVIMEDSVIAHLL